MRDWLFSASVDINTRNQIICTFTIRIVCSQNNVTVNLQRFKLVYNHLCIRSTLADYHYDIVSAIVCFNALYVIYSRI
jgi:hypothetical protein